MIRRPPRSPLFPSPTLFRSRTTRCSLAFVLLAASLAYGQSKPSTLLADGQPVDWWFVFKFNAESFPACGGSAQRACLVGGTVPKYKNLGQQFAFANSGSHSVTKRLRAVSKLSVPKWRSLASFRYRSVCQSRSQ